MCRQTTCKQAWRVVSPKIRCPLATHLHKHTQKYAAPALNSIHSRVWNYFQLIFHAAYFPDRFLFKSSGLNWKKLKSPCVAPANNECMFCSFLKQSAKAWRPTMMKKKNKGGVRRVGWGGELQKKTLLPSVGVQKRNSSLHFETEPKGQRVLVDCRPLQGLVHLHIVQSILNLPSAPRRPPCLPRCSAVYVEQQ